MQHWHPGPHWDNSRSARYPPGWWIWPAVIIGAFMWAAIIVLPNWRYYADTVWHWLN
jgi:hypothetical protein